MNEDTLNACYKAFENDCYNYVIFSESNEGEITYFCQKSTQNVDYLYTDYYSDGGKRAKLHLFKFEKGNLEWIESYIFATKMVEMQVDISDEVFMTVARMAHEKNITFNEEIINIMKQYIDGKVTV